MPEKIVIPSAQFKRYKKLASEEASVKRARKKLIEKWEKLGLLPDATLANVGREYVVTTLTGDEQGKLTVYAVAPFQNPGFIARKIT